MDFADTEPTIPGQLTNLQRRADAVDKRLSRIEFHLAENTELTRSIRDALAFGRVGTKLFKWAGAIALACTAIYTGFYTIAHGGKPPTP